MIREKIVFIRPPDVSIPSILAGNFAMLIGGSQGGAILHLALYSGKWPIIFATMPKQRVPDIDFDHFVLGEIIDLFKENKIYINPDYQRGDIWKDRQQIELIRSIDNRYSIGVIVLFINDKDQFEILDGQQRLLAVTKYLNGSLDLQNADLTPYKDLNNKEKILIDAYCIYYLKLKSHDAENKEEDIVQTFLRLQEGTPLNKAEKISAYRGAFKDAFKKARDESKLFQLLHGDKRFRFRQLAAEMLLLELDGDFDNRVFPSLELKNLVFAIERYKKSIPSAKLRFYTGNLELLHSSLNYLLTAFKPREVLAFYLLISYLRKHKTQNENLANEVSAFAKEFLHNLNSFGIYDKTPPKGMPKTIFEKYRSYKLEAKVMTTPESIKKRFDMILEEFSRLKPFIKKDSQRYHTEEQKRVLYFRQKGLCAFCRKKMEFKQSSADHMIAHSAGGRTNDLEHAQLLHEKCHRKLEESRKQSKQKSANRSK